MNEIQNLLEAYQDIFSKGETDIGFNNTVKHRKDLLDEKPYKQRTRRIPPVMFEEIINQYRCYWILRSLGNHVHHSPAT